jgi:5-methylcytosine-specific restriction endonuclease McrA
MPAVVLMAHDKYKVKNLNTEVSSELRKMVFFRDNWTCQRCELTNSQLQCHHIDPKINNPIEAEDLDNCITLCSICHTKAHYSASQCSTGFLAQCGKKRRRDFNEKINN